MVTQSRFGRSIEVASLETIEKIQDPRSGVHRSDIERASDHVKAPDIIWCGRFDFVLEILGAGQLVSTYYFECRFVISLI